MNEKLDSIQIIHIDIEGGFGGSSRSLYELAIELKKQNIKQTIFLRKEGPVVAKYTEKDIKHIISEKIISRIPLKKNNIKNLITMVVRIHYLFLFQRELSQKNASILHFNHDGLMFAAALSKIFKPKTKTILHSRYEWPNNYFARLFSKVINFGSDKIIAISKPVADALVYSGVPQHKIEIHHNVSHMADRPYHPLRVKKALDPIHLSFLGTLNEVKNPSALIPLADELEKRQIPFDIKIFGGAPRRKSLTKNLLEVEDLLQDREKRSRDGAMFRVMGHTSEPELEILKSDIILRPSIRNDPWGRDIIESMCLGRIVIASGENDEFIRTGHNGFLVGEWNATKVADILQHLYTDAEKLEKMSQNAHRDAAQMFSPQRASEQFLSTVGQLAHEN